MASTSVRFEEYPNNPYVSLFPDVLCNNCFQCHRMTQNTFQERYTLLCFTSNQCILFILFIILPHTMNYKQNKNDNKQVN